jgi:hypothetical protein
VPLEEQQQMKPTLEAEFILDDQGIPVAIQAGDRTHYKIRLFVNDAPDDTYAVTYQLHESYYDPVRETRDRSNGFEEEITSYGDYTIQARLRTKKNVETLADSLGGALTRHHSPPSSNSAIENALRNIREH